MAIAPTEIPLPVEPTTPIKPTEALRLGRLIRPLRCEGLLFEGDFAACAMGAIAVGYGLPALTGVLGDIRTWYALDRLMPRDIVDEVWLMYDDGAMDEEVIEYLEGLGL